jgi:hypothetical protein
MDKENPSGNARKGGELLAKAWNGPFALGPLTKPVAPMDALMKVLEVAWKAGFLLLLFAIVGGAISGLLRAANSGQFP